MTNKTEIGNCRDCRWWGTKYESWPSGEPIKTCGKNVDHAKSMMMMKPIGHLDGIMTGPDFGCIHWKEKE